MDSSITDVLDDTETVVTEPRNSEPANSDDDATDQSPTEESTEDDQEDDDRTGGREAAKYRRQLRATETERDQLRDQLAAQRRAVVDWRSSNAVGGAVDPELLDAAGIDVDTLIDPDTGQLDMTAVDAFIETTAAKFRVQRSIQPVRQQGQPSQRGGGASWSDVIKSGAKSG